MYTVGQTYQWDMQADVFQGSFKVVADLGGGLFEIERLEPSDEMLDRIEAAYASGNVYLGYVDPYGPGRREATPAEAAEIEIERYIALTGTRSKIRAISRAEYDRSF